MKAGSERDRSMTQSTTQTTVSGRKWKWRGGRCGAVGPRAHTVHCTTCGGWVYLSLMGLSKLMDRIHVCLHCTVHRSPFS